jgi:hypothetical protein
MAHADTDRNLLFGLLALQIGLIDQDQLLAAFRAWSRDKARSLADHLAGRGDLDAEQRALIDSLVAQHLKKHGGSTEKSLAALIVGRSTHDSLAQAGGPDIEASLAPSPAGDRTERGRGYRCRPRPHRHVLGRHGHQRRPAVPHPPPPRARRARRRFRGPGQRAQPRGRTQADP